MTTEGDAHVPQSSHAPLATGDLTAVTRELYSALMDARPYVATIRAIGLDSQNLWLTTGAADKLERIDGALMDAAELLAQVSP